MMLGPFVQFGMYILLCVLATVYISGGLVTLREEKVKFGCHAMHPNTCVQAWQAHGQNQTRLQHTFGLGGIGSLYGAPLVGDLTSLNFYLSNKQLADELRSNVILHVSKTGGHLGSSPRRGRADGGAALRLQRASRQDPVERRPPVVPPQHKMPTQRQTSGLSGFIKHSGSNYDFFSTAISASPPDGRGEIPQGRKNKVVTVIGDGAMTAAQVYKAMNNAGYLDFGMIVILNDNRTGLSAHGHTRRADPAGRA